MRFAGFGFLGDEFGQSRVVVYRAVEEEQQRMMPAPFEFGAE